MAIAQQSLHIEAIPAFKDNYLWLISQQEGNSAWVVDPGDAAPVLARLCDKNLSLTGVLLTHHHPDHQGGIPTLLQHFPGLAIVSGLNSKTTHPNICLADGEAIKVLGHNIILMDVPGHTLDHVAFYSPEAGVLFSGDTLFAGGCGRLFDGKIEQLFNSLCRIATLPGTTLNYCAHEYTLSNLRFALAVEPENPSLLQRNKDAQRIRALQKPTIPSLLSLELATNPFLRCNEPSIMAAAQRHAGRTLSSTLETFTALRAWKDHF